MVNVYYSSLISNFLLLFIQIFTAHQSADFLPIPIFPEKVDEGDFEDVFLRNIPFLTVFLHELVEAVEHVDICYMWYNIANN
jgi:hypothetical protein